MTQAGRGVVECSPYRVTCVEFMLLLYPFTKEFWSSQNNQHREPPWSVFAIYAIFDLPLSALVDTVMLPYDLREREYPSIYDVKPSTYDAYVRNLSSNKIEVYRIDGNPRYPHPRAVKAGGFSWKGSNKIGKFVTIKWKKENGEVIEKQMELKKKLPRGFWNGDGVIFNIDGNDNVILSFRIKDAPLFEVDSSRKKVDYALGRSKDSLE